MLWYTLNPTLDKAMMVKSLALGNIDALNLDS
jgi:hypothetical protein